MRESALPPTGALAGTTAYQSSQYLANGAPEGQHPDQPERARQHGAPVWGLASKFQPVDLTASVVSHHLRPYDVGLAVDLVKNLGWDAADIVRRAGTNSVAGLVKMTTGYQLRLNVGKPRLQEAGDWQGLPGLASLRARCLGRRLHRHHLASGRAPTTRASAWAPSLAFDRRATLGLRFTSTRNLDDGVRFTDSNGAVSGDLSSAPLKIDVLQLEANLRF